MPKGLVILHIDGLGYDYFQKALAQGEMPFTKKLIEHEDYEILPYRCGIPSTTPFAQAGILYGDNTNIPSFRWWDKESGLLVAFGNNSSFKHVRHKYFQNCEPLVKGGACIAACYPAGAEEDFGLAYRERDYSHSKKSSSALHVIVPFLANPSHLLDWIVHGSLALWSVNKEYWRSRLRGHPGAKMYVFSNMLEEIFLHHVTRYAVKKAMTENYPIVYAGLYAYDETAHAFGPEDDYSTRMLRHVDHTIEQVAKKRKRGRAGARDYELLIVSDHGHVETEPFDHKDGRHLGELISDWLPNFQVEEYRGKKFKPKDDALDGHIALTYSGGLAHLYFKDISARLGRKEIEQRFPGLIENIVRTKRVDFVMLRDGQSDLLVTEDKTFKLGESALASEAREFLARLDDPDIIAQQLLKLNSFERSGDLIIFGKFTKNKQINFEHQVGGHGSVGGEQLHPFVLAKREWKFDTSRVTSASELYPLLKRLKDQVLGE